jgi:hypothetical protein
MNKDCKVGDSRQNSPEGNLFPFHLVVHNESTAPLGSLAIPPQKDNTTEGERLERRKMVPIPFHALAYGFVRQRTVRTVFLKNGGIRTDNIRLY